MQTRTPRPLRAGNFLEEMGISLTARLQPLGEIRQRGGKQVQAFAVEADIDVRAVASNMFEIEWPPKSGKMQPFLEIDRAEWFDLPAARDKLLRASGCFSIGLKPS